MRVLQSTYVNTLPPSIQSEEYAYTLIDPPAKIPCNIMDTSFTELIAKSSIDIADNSPVNRTDNCLLSDRSILLDSSVFDPYPVTSPAQPGYLPEQLPRDCHRVKHPQQFVTSAVISLSTSEPQSDIFHARSVHKLYSCDTTKCTDELPELPKLLKDKESVKPSHEQ